MLHFLAQFTLSKLARFSVEFHLEFIVLILLYIGVVSRELSKETIGEIQVDVSSLYPCLNCPVATCVGGVGSEATAAFCSFFRQENF